MAGVGTGMATLGAGAVVSVLNARLALHVLALLGGVLVGAVAITVLVLRRPPEAPVRRGARVLVIAAASLTTGLVLAAVGGAIGPLAMLLLPAVLIALVLIVVRPIGAVIAVLLALPIGLQPLPGNSLGLDLMQVVAAVAVGAAVTGRMVMGHLPVRVPRQLVWALLFLGWAVVATGSAVSFDFAVRQLAQLTVNISLVLLVATIVTSLEQVRRLLWVLMASATVIAVPSLASADELRPAYGGAVVTGRLEGTFTQPNELGSFAMVVIVLGAALLLGARSNRERLLTFAAVLPVLGTLFLSLSRGSWIGAVCGGLVLLVLLPSARRSVVVAGVPVVLLAVAFGSFAPDNPQVEVVGDRVATFAAPGGGNPYDDRPRIWAEGRREVRLDPVTGHGPGNFPIVSTRSASSAQTVQAAHAHNVLLTVAAEYGLPGAGLLVALTVAVGYLIRDAMRRVRGPDATLVVGLAAACVAIAAQGVIDYTMRNAVLFTFFWLVLGLLVAAGRAAVALPQPELAETEALPSTPRLPVPPASGSTGRSLLGLAGAGRSPAGR